MPVVTFFAENALSYVSQLCSIATHCFLIVIVITLHASKSALFRLTLCLFVTVIVITHPTSKGALFILKANSQHTTGVSSIVLGALLRSLERSASLPVYPESKVATIVSILQ